MTKQAVVHNATTEHLTEGWERWRAACPCGWSKRTLGPVLADHLADVHNRLNPGGGSDAT